LEKPVSKTTVDLSLLDVPTLAALKLTVPSLTQDVDDELSRRDAFLSIEEGMDAVALGAAQIAHWRATHKLTEVAKTLLVDLGIEKLLNGLLATARTMGVVYNEPTLEQVSPFVRSE
jgi:hypothetical protein